MKRVLLTKTEIERIELKFECLRRSPKYRKDYQNLKQLSKKSKPRHEELEGFFMQKWFHFPLLNPDISISTYNRKLKKRYLYWLERTLGGLIISDSISPQSLSVISPELRKYLSLKKRGYSQVYGIKKRKFIRTPLATDDKIYSQLDIKKIKEELRAVKLVVDLKSVTEDEIKKQVSQLFKKLKSLRDRFLYEKKTVSIRPSYVMEYLEIYDRKLNKSHKEMSGNENQVRKFKKQIRIAKLLIKGGWRGI